MLVPRVQADAFVLDMLESEDLRLLYLDPPQTFLTPHVARTFHHSLEFQKELFDWKPWDRTTVMLTDFSDYGNASAGVTPFNSLFLDVAPLNRAFETFSANERFFLYMNHELVHVATMDVWNQQDAGWRKFLRGKPPPDGRHPESVLWFYLAAPRVATPRWYTEGSAVFMETWLGGGIGRAQGAYDEMVFRAMVRDGAHFYSNLGLVSEGTKVDFQVGVNAYLYGTRFMSYLALVYTPEKVIEWLRRDEDSKRYYATQFQHVFGLPLQDAWDDWIEFEKGFQQKNLEKVRTHPLTPGTALSNQALGSISRAVVDENRNVLLAGFRYPGVLAHLGQLDLDSGSLDRLKDIKGPSLYQVTSLALDPDSGTLFYTNDNQEYRDLMALDLDSGKSRLLQKDARIGDLAFSRSDGSLWGLRHLNGYVTVVRLQAPFSDWQQVFTFPYGVVPYDIDVSPDGTLLSASVGEVSGRQYLRVFKIEDLQSGQAEPVRQFDFGTAVPEGFVFSGDGRYLYGSSYYTGISNIFRYEWETGDIEAVSNAETGFFRPIPMSDGSLIVFEYTGSGFIPKRIDPQPLEDLSAIEFLGTRIVYEHPVVRDWSVGSPKAVAVEDLMQGPSEFRPPRELRTSGAYPFIAGYRGSAAIGYHWQMQDPVSLNALSVDVAYSPDSSLPSDERVHLDVNYRYLNWNFRYWHNLADFYDLFGPTERARKGDALIGGYQKALIFDLPKRLDFKAEVAWYTGLDTLPNNQNVPTSFEELLSARAGLEYRHVRRSLGAVDDEKGWRWNVQAYLDHAEGETIPKIRAGLDFGFALPWRHSSLWLHNDVGYANGDRENSLANWFFGAFGNNYVDDREVKRYREFYSFPGFDIDEINGQDFVRSLVEWNIPPVHFREVGIPSAYLTWLRPSLFAGVLASDARDSDHREVYQSMGAQIDLQFTVVHRLPMTLSLGYARGYVDGRHHDSEWMLSLKIL